MRITRTCNSTTYSCLICGYNYIEYNDGSVEGEPFKIAERPVVTYKPVIEHTNMGTRRGSEKVTHTGYICPCCNKLQIEI